jgi:molecular chaperone GrpE
MKSRIEEGQQETGEGSADTPGGPDPSELPRSRTDQDTTVSHSDPEGQGGGGASGSAPEPTRSAAGAGPQVAELKKLTDERQDFNDKLARRTADFDNFRKRTERERTETYNRALGEVVRRLLPVLDNLQRALDAERVVEVKESEEFRHFLHGVELINRQLGSVLEGLGIEVVPTVGERFDPHVHEAVATEETDAHEPDTVTQEMQRGYRLGDKLLRPAMVKVATKA